jgi:hypothetical protein
MTHPWIKQRASRPPAGAAHGALERTGQDDGNLSDDHPIRNNPTMITGKLERHLSSATCWRHLPDRLSASCH